MKKLVFAASILMLSLGANAQSPGQSRSEPTSDFQLAMWPMFPPLLLV